MNARPLAVRDVVALLNDVEAHDLARGQMGTVVNRLADDVLEVEFGQVDGRAHFLLPLHQDTLLLLHQRPLKPRFAPGATADLPSWEPPPPSDPDPLCCDTDWDALYGKGPGDERDNRRAAAIEPSS